MLASITQRFNTLLLVLIALMVASLIAILASRAGAGSLDPPAAPASTFRNVIFQPASCAGFPITISQAGSYLLGGDITGCASKDGIDIATSNVTLDLAGHNVFGTGFTGSSLIGIHNSGSNGQITVSNGFVSQWGQSGIDLGGSSVANVDHIVATYNGIDGIRIGTASAVTDSTGSANVQHGIVALGANDRITACQADSNRGSGVVLSGDGSAVEDCEVSGNQLSAITGANIERITRNHVHNNGGNGIAVGQSSTIVDNSVAWNGQGGVYCTSNCSISHNTAANNALTGLAAVGSVGVLVDNSVFANSGYGIAVGNVSAGFPNVIENNVSTGNAGGNYNIGLNNDLGPLSTAGGATAPSTNYNQ